MANWSNSASTLVRPASPSIWRAGEDHPVPNLHIARTSHAGDITTVGIGTHAALLKTIEDMLGVPFMNQGQLPGATDLRSVIGI